MARIHDSISHVKTGVDIQAGEHALITATGKLRYGDVKEDNGPDGLPRGFKDLLRVLPFNEAGRGAMSLRQSLVGFLSASIRLPTTRATALTLSESRFTRTKAARRAWLPGKLVQSRASTIISFRRSRAASAIKRVTRATWSIS